MFRLLLLVGTLSGTFGSSTWLLRGVMIFFSIYLYWVLLHSFRRPKRVTGNYHPKVSVLIPAHNEQEVIGHTVQSILAQTYDNLEIVVIDDASDDLTTDIAQKLADSYDNVKMLRRELSDERGKPAALNDALKLATGEVIVVFDADTEIKPDFIVNVIPHLADPDTAGVQTKVRMYNRNHNIWTMVQDSEFAVHCSVIQAGRDIMQGCCGLGGNGQFVKREALQTVNGWKTGKLAEDFDLTLTLMQEGYKIGYVDEPVYQEAVDSFKRLFKQRNRWSQGGLQSTIAHFVPVLKSKKIPWRTKLDIFYVFSSVIQPFILLTSFGLTSVDVLNHQGFHFHLTNVDPITLTLFLSYILFMVVGHIKGKPEDKKRFLFLIPLYYVYSLMWSIIYLYSVFQFIMKRGKLQWVKTQHKGAGTSISA